jgi:hypothetical protein
MGGWVGDATHMGVEVSAGVARSLDEVFQRGADFILGCRLTYEVVQLVLRGEDSLVRIPTCGCW